MDRISFLAVLAEKLAALSLPEDEIQRQVNNMQRYLFSLSDEEFAADNPSEKDAEMIALNLYEKYQSDQEAKAKAEAEPQGGDTPLPSEAAFAAAAAAESVTEAEATEPEEEAEASAEPTTEEVLTPEPEKVEKSDDEGDFFEELASQAEDERRAQEIKQVAIERAIADGAIPENAVVDGDVIVTGEGEGEADDEGDPIEETLTAQERPDIAYDESKKRYESRDEAPEYSPVDDFDSEYEEEDAPTTKKKREKVKGSVLFWTLFIVTLPITLPLFALVCVFFGALYAVVTAGLIALVLLLISMVAVGVALALLGIIYGAAQTVKIMPIGLMEIGIGIVLGGATMLLGILLYQFSIRIYPKLYKLLNRFSSFTFGKISDLFYNCKKGVGRK